MPRARAKEQPTPATIFESARAALETSLKAAGVSDELVSRETAALGEKCGMDMPYEVVVYTPYGGASSFDEIDTFEQSQELDERIAEVTEQFQAIVGNVLGNAALTMAEKETRIAAAATEMRRRVEAGPVEGEREAPHTPVKVGSTAAGGTSFKAFKEGESWRWFAVYSNTGWDKGSKAHPQGERFPEAAHKDFTDYVWADPDHRMPELWDWHTPVGVATYHDGRKGMGRADFIDFADGLAIAAGHFYPEFNDVAERISTQKEIGVSHGYEYEPHWLKPTGEYTAYRSFEISPLPRSRAANELTLFMPELAEKESPMLSAHRRPQLVKDLGEDRVKAIEAALAPAAAALAAAGKEVSFKDLEDALASNDASVAAAASVPVANAAAGASTPAPMSEQQAKDALASVITAAVKEGVAPLEARIAALEKNPTDVKEMISTAVKEAFGPRQTPAPGSAPSESASTVINGNTGAVQAAKQGAKEGAPTPEGVPAHLAWYFQNGAAALMGGFAPNGVPDSPEAAAAVVNAASQFVGATP